MTLNMTAGSHQSGFHMVNNRTGLSARSQARASTPTRMASASGDLCLSTATTRSVKSTRVTGTVPPNLWSYSELTYCLTPRTHASLPSASLRPIVSVSTLTPKFATTSTSTACPTKASMSSTPNNNSEFCKKSPSRDRLRAKTSIRLTS